MRPCSECAKWIYDRNGNIEIGRDGKQLRNASGKTPCHSCPKMSPQEAWQHELSERNQRAVYFYQITRAMHGANLTDEMKSDDTVQRNLRLIDEIIRPLEQERAIAAVLAASGGGA